jgi:hypothetical protein
MTTVAYSRFAFFFLAALGLLFVASGARAQNSSDPGTASGLQIPTQGTEHIRVVGHLPLENMRVNQMFVQQRGSKVYLFLHRPTKQAYAVVDVTKPDNPVLVSRNALKESGSTQVEGPAPGSVFAIAVTPENAAESQASTAAPLPSETVQFVDMSNPKSAKTVKIFKGVTSIYPDDARKLVYLVNGEGLWIVSHHMTHPLPLCNSESALTPEPDCQ